jgi:transposase-like protein
MTCPEEEPEASEDLDWEVEEPYVRQMGKAFYLWSLVVILVGVLILGGFGWVLVVLLR